MSTKERLQKEKEQLREDYKAFPEKRKDILTRVSEIEVLLKNMCYWCGKEPRKYNEYYCSKECNEKYYTKPIDNNGREKLTVYEMQQRLLQLGKQARERLNQNGKV